MVNPECNIANKAAKAAKARNKAARKQTLEDIAQCIYDARKNNNGSVPHKFIANLVDTMKCECPWINRDVINYHYNQWSRTERYSRRVDLDRMQDNPSEVSSPVHHDDGVSILTEPYLDRKKGGRPKGTTNRTKRSLQTPSLLLKTKL